MPTGEQIWRNKDNDTGIIRKNIIEAQHNLKNQKAAYE